MFSTDNEKIKAIYGNYCFWSWLRYWHLDNADYVTLMLMDKGYYDYDYEAPTKKEVAAMTAAKSDKELEERLKKMGFSIKPKSAKNTQVSAEQLQLEVMEEEKKKQAARHGKSV